MPTLFVGEARKGPRGAGPFDPSTRAGKRLADLLGVEDLTRTFGVVNLIDRWPGRTAHGTAFPAGRAREAAFRLAHGLPDDVRLVLVGQRVAAAFLRPELRVTPLKWVELLTSIRPDTPAKVRKVTVLPHPAARWWSEPANEARARRFLRRLAREENT